MRIHAMCGRRWRAALALLPACVALAAAAPRASAAATIAYAPGTAAGDTDTVTVTDDDAVLRLQLDLDTCPAIADPPPSWAASGGCVRLTAFDGAIAPEAGDADCVALSSTAVDCPYAGNFVVHLAGGDDGLILSSGICFH